MTDNKAAKLEALQAEIATLKAQQELEALKAAKTTVENPIQPGQAVVLTRGTSTGFEQGMAALGGLLTAGPLGAIAAWGAIRGLQGKWLPWFILGVPAAPLLLTAQIATLGGLVGGATFDFSDDAPAAIERPVEQSNNQSQAPFEINGNIGSAPIAPAAFQMEAGGPLVDCNNCTVSSRINANGHTVYDVVEGDGYKRSVVLWTDGSAEIFADYNDTTKRYTGSWTEGEGYAYVTVGQGTFAFAF